MTLERPTALVGEISSDRNSAGGNSKVSKQALQNIISMKTVCFSQKIFRRNT